MELPPKTEEYITLYDLRGPWAEESAKKIILQRINTKIDTIIKEKDREKEEAVAEERERLLKMFDEFNDEIEFEEMAQMVRRFIQALTQPIN